jgi:hypothetical protein
VEYFNSRIAMLQTQSNINTVPVNKNITSNVNVPDTSHKQQKNVETVKVPISGPSKSLDDLPDVKDENNFSYKNMGSVHLDDIPRLVDRSIKLPILKTSSEYLKVKELVKNHIEYSSLELDFHKLEIAKDHVEAAIYYMRNID